MTITRRGFLANLLTVGAAFAASRMLPELAAEPERYTGDDYGYGVDTTAFFDASVPAKGETFSNMLSPGAGGPSIEHVREALRQARYDSPVFDPEPFIICPPAFEQYAREILAAGIDA